MEVTGDRQRFREACYAARTDARMVGLVPTMGALHEGHASLVRTARGECGFVAISIFVNPLQFGPEEDLSSYPRPRERDLAVAGDLGCDLAFTPATEEIYPGGPIEVTVDPGPLGERLEGSSRPGHFRGVLTVVAKLLHLAGPSRAYFGWKDAQQLELVRRMVRDLDLAGTVVACATVRAADGLALSSRNAYLTPPERAAAPVLFDALTEAATLARRGERDGNALRAAMARRIGAEPLARLDYVAIVDDQTWADADSLRSSSRALVAARIGSTRLIDNLLLPWEPGSRAGSVQNTD